MNTIPGTAEFECEITIANAKAVWSKGKTVLSTGQKYKPSVAGGIHKLTIEKVDGEDEGEYSVSFENENIVSTAKLTVNGEFLFL